MSLTLRRQKLEAALQALACAASNIDDAQIFADAIGDRVDADGCMDIALASVDHARDLTRWALKLLEGMPE